MNTQSIVDRILSDAKKQASNVLEDALKKANEAQEAAQHRLQEEKAALSKRVETDAAEMADRMRRMADLDSKKALLRDKRMLIDEAFDTALANLKALPDAQMAGFLLKQLVETADGGETVLASESCRQVVNDAFLQRANEGLKALGKQPVTLGTDTVSGTGFALKEAGSLTSCTLEAILQDVRHQNETEVAALLFP